MRRPDATDRPSLPAGRTALLGALSGALAGAAFTPIGAWPLAWVALAPWFVGLSRTSVRGAVGSGFVFGTVFFWFAMAWLRHPTWYAALGLGLYHGLFFAGASLALRPLARSRSVFVLACAWVGIDLLLGRLFTGIPWLLLGYSQIGWPTVIQIADLAGVHGVTFLLALTGAAVAAAWRAPPGRALRGAIVPALCLGAAVAYGLTRPTTFAAVDGPRIAGIQPNIPQALKDATPKPGTDGVFERNDRLTRAALASPPDLLIWSETMNPFHNLGTPDVPRFANGAEAFGRLARETYRVPWLLGTPYYFGAPQADGWPPYSNAAVLFGADGRILGRYDKLHPIPWGEYVPLGLGFIADFLEGFTGFPLRMQPGREATVLEAADARFGTLICFDVIYPRYARQMVRGGAQFLVNLTNEAWFLESAEFDQLLAQSVFRAIENRIDVVRVTNSGISAHIDAGGRIVARVEEGGRDRAVQGVLRCRPGLRGPTTVYTRAGDGFAIGAAAVGLIGLFVGRFRARRRKSGS